MDETGSYNRPRPLSATGEMMAPYKFREQSQVMEQGVKQNPYMPGRPWSPGQDEDPYKKLDIWESLQQNNKNRKIY